MKRYRTARRTVGVPILFILFLTSFGAQAQIDSSLLQKQVWRVYLPGAQGEFRLGRKTTLVADAGLATLWRLRGTSLGGSATYFGYRVNPFVSVGARYFYNLQKRQARGRSLRYNSGNYLMAQATYLGGTLFSQNTFETGLMEPRGVYYDLLWGMQRTYRRNFYLDLRAGAQFQPGGVVPTVGLRLGYTFP